MSSDPVRQFTDFTKQCRLQQYILLTILINISYSLTPNEWYNFSTATKEYLYHDECLVLTQEIAENICKNTHNGDNVASIASVEARDWFLNTLITSQPTDGGDACSSYNTASSPGYDRYIVFGGTFIANGAAKAEPGGLVWWNGDSYDPSLIPWALNNPNTAAWLEPAIILGFKEKAMYDQAFGGRSYAVLCERTLPTSYPTIDPTLNPTTNTTYNPSRNPSIAPTEPTLNPSTNSTSDDSVISTLNPTSNPSKLSDSSHSTTSQYVEDKTFIYINISINNSDIEIDRVIKRLNESVKEYLIAMDIDYDLHFDIIQINDNVTIIIIVIVIYNLDGSIIDDLEQKIKDDLSGELDGDKNTKTKPSDNDRYFNEITNIELVMICVGIVFILVIILIIISCYWMKRRKYKKTNDEVNIAKIVSSIIDGETIKKKDVKIINKSEIVEQSVSDEMYINNGLDITTQHETTKNAMESSSSSDEDIFQIATIEGDKMMHQEGKNKINTEIQQTTTNNVNGDV